MDRRTNQNIEREHFDALAQDQGEIWWGSTTKAGIRRLERRAKIVKDKLSRYGCPRVFELGCGTGAFTKYILEAMPDLDLTACDISPECIKISAGRYANFKNARFLVSDVTSNPMETGRFQAVIGNSVLHHLPAKLSLEYCFMLLDSKGVIVFFEPNMMNPQVAIEKNIHFIGKMLQNTKNEMAFFRWDVRKFLEGAGFTDIEVSPFDFLHPGVPPGLVDLFEGIGKRLEKFPILREISGSLMITAVKP